MKRVVFFVLYILVCHVVMAQKEIELNINAGIPFAINNENFYLECKINRSVLKNIFAGLGVNYSSIDSKPAINRLTYDRNTFSSFIFLGNSFNIKNCKIDISPQFKTGYSFYSYSLNEFTMEKKKDNGFFLAPGITVNYPLNDKWFINLTLFYNLIVNSYKTNINFSVLYRGII